MKSGDIPGFCRLPAVAKKTRDTSRLVLIRLRHSEEAGKGTDEMIVGGFSNLPTVRFYS